MVSDEELDILEQLVHKTLNPLPENVLRLEPDGAGYYWSKERNALNHFAAPHRLLEMVQEIRSLRSEVARAKGHRDA